MVTAALVSGGAGDSVLTVVRLETDAGSRAEVQLLAGGARQALCRLPEASGAIELAHFSTTALVITVRRADGGVALESYNFGLLPVSRSGWPAVNGVGGTRSNQ